jgi:peptide/nickel transport system permease protein
MAAVVFERLETTPGRQTWKRLARRGAAMFGFGVVLFFVIMAVLAPWLAPYDPLATSWSAIRAAPSTAHWFGADELGRDVLSRIIWGARASILAGVVSVSISLALGVPIGMLAGYVGRWVDVLISRITDAMLACPFLILAIALAAFLGPSLTNAMIAIGISATPIFIRLTRAQVLAAKSEDYVEAARALGNPHVRIALRHIFPNIVAPLIVQATLAIAEHRRAAHRAGDIGHRRGRHRGGFALVPRFGPAATGAELGQHAQHRAQLRRPGAVDGDLARALDLPARAVLQPAGRRIARRAGSATQIIPVPICPGVAGDKGPAFHSFRCTDLYFPLNSNCSLWICPDSFFGAARRMCLS